MKKIYFFLLLLCLPFFVMAQVPQKVKYKAVARDGDGSLIRNTRIDLRLSILSALTGEDEEYIEEHTVSTNQYGMFVVDLGNGVATKGDFEAVKWEEGGKYLRVQLKTSTQASYVTIGTSQILSVPYALYSEKAKGLTGENDISNINEIQTINIRGDTITLSNNGGQINIGGVVRQNVLNTLNDPTSPEVKEKIEPFISAYLQLNDTTTKNDADADPKNEIQRLELDGSFLKIVDGNGNVQNAVDLGLVVGRVGPVGATGASGARGRDGADGKDGVAGGVSLGGYTGNVVLSSDLALTSVGANVQLSVSTSGVIGSAVNWVSANSAVVSANSNAIRTNSGNIALNSASIGTNSGNIALNSSSIGTNSGNIALNSTSIVSNSTFITGIQDGTANISVNSVTITDNLTFVTTSGAGTLQINADGLVQSSDKRLKNTIHAIDNALLRINSSEGVTYYWNSDKDRKSLQYGVIAQEIEKLFPELVRTDERGYKQVNYIGLIPVLIQAIKEQQKMIVELQKQNTELQTKISETDDIKLQLEVVQQQMQLQQQQLDLLMKLMQIQNMEETPQNSADDK